MNPKKSKSATIRKAAEPNADIESILGKGKTTNILKEMPKGRGPEASSPIEPKPDTGDSGALL